MFRRPAHAEPMPTGLPNPALFRGLIGKGARAASCSLEKAMFLDAIQATGDGHGRAPMTSHYKLYDLL